VKIAELFVQLGVKGADKTSGALKDIKSGMVDIAIATSAAVAAVSAAIYAFKQFSEQSNEAGKNLKQFENFTGISADRLQRWQYLALKSGVSAQQVAQDFKAVQGVISQMVLGKGRPEGLGALINTVGFDVRRARDTEYVLNKLREYAQKTKGLPESNKILASFGLSNDVIQTLKTSTLDLEKVSLSHRYAPGEINALNKMAIAWSQLGDKVEHALGRLNVRFGPSLLKDLFQLTDAVLKLVNAFASLAEKLQVLKGISKLINITAGVTEFAAKDVDLIRKGKGAEIVNQIGHGLTNAFESVSQYVKPLSTGLQPAGVVPTSHTTININEAHDPHLTAKIVKQHLDQQNNNAFRALPQSIP